MWYIIRASVFFIAGYIFAALIGGGKVVDLENRITELEYKQLEKLIDQLPENRPIYKDSGLWQFRSDRMDVVLLQQKDQETFTEFIKRYLGLK